MWLDGLTMVANLERLCRPWCVWAAEEGGLNYHYREGELQ